MIAERIARFKRNELNFAATSAGVTALPARRDKGPYE